ncbi:hypothetical protein [Cupriavidus sp. D384]|uniref:hypothetical protein n=1 Tax=Cupriavidus sp. D384 TaxID=1538095 RepID=UPI00083273A1|nr:hypothetical protein [Cupriavidus sp. D384]
MHDTSRIRQHGVANPAAALVQVDRHIAEGRAIIRRQIAVLRHLQQDGLPMHNGLELLAALRETVDALRRHRRFVLEAMPAERLDAAAHPGGAPSVRQAEGA